MHLFLFASASQPGPGRCNINCFFADSRTWAFILHFQYSMYQSSTRFEFPVCHENKHGCFLFASSTKVSEFVSFLSSYSSSASNRSACFYSSFSEVVVNCERKLQQHSGIASQVLLCASWNCGNSFKNFHCCLGCPLSWGSRNTHTLLPSSSGQHNRTSRKEACVHLLQKFRQTDGFVKVQWWFWCERLLYSSIANCLARMQSKRP